MAYVPNNLQMFTAAFAGALAGMGASDRVPTDTNQADYSGLASVAGAFAQSFDTEWGVVAETLLDIESAQELCEVAWQDRSPQAVAPFTTPSNYTQLSQALIAMIKAGGTYFTEQGIVPPGSFATLSNANPANVGNAPSAGIAGDASRSDHVHDIEFATVNATLAAANADISVNNQEIINLGAPMAATSAARLGDIPPPNPSAGLIDNVQTSDGVGGFQAPTNVLAGNNFVSIGPVGFVPGAGYMRLSHNPALAEDVITVGTFNFLHMAAGGMFIGTTPGGVGQATALTLASVTGVSIGTGLTLSQFRVLPAGIQLNGTSVERIYTGDTVGNSDGASGSTVGAVTVPIYSFTPAEDQCILIEGKVEAAIAGGGGSAVLYFARKVYMDGGVITVSGAGNIFADIDVALAGVTADFVVVGANVELQVTGVAATTIRWGARVDRERELGYV